MSGKKAKEKRRLAAEERRFSEMAAANGGRLVFFESNLPSSFKGLNDGRK